MSALTTSTGKTTFTLGLLELLRRNWNVKAFKTGPDFIDPMFHAAVTGEKGVNLDSYFETGQGLKKRFFQAAGNCDFAVIEGVMGHLDGLKNGAASSDEVAALLGVPVLLLVEEIPSTRTVAAMIDGVVKNSQSNVDAVVVTKSRSLKLFEMQKAEIESVTGVCVAGRLPYSDELVIPSRHLGLDTDMAILNREIKKTAGICASMISDNVNTEAIFGGRDLYGPEKAGCFVKTEKKACRKKAAVTRDEAFCFCYDANLRWLEETGYDILFFSPLHDCHPPDADFYYLCGGYPELYAKKLAANVTMVKDIRCVCEENSYVLAECGGYMYLCESVGDFPTAGFFKGNARLSARMSPKFGYEKMTVLNEGFFKAGTVLKGHEFHYGFIENLPEENGMKVTKISGGEEFISGLSKKNTLGSFSHLYFPSAGEER